MGQLKMRGIDQSTGRFRWYESGDTIVGAGGEGSVSWGGILGTLSAQTDLSGALAGKSATTHSHAPTDVTGTAVITNDSRLSDARTPTTHDNTKHSVAYITTSDETGTTIRTKLGITTLSGSNTGDQTLPTDATLSVSDVTTNNVSITKHGFVPKAPDNTTTFLRGDATWATPAGGGESENIVRATADSSNSTTTFADATGLSFSVAANKDYIFEAFILFQSNTATVGIKLGVNGPTSPTAVGLQTHIPTSLVATTHGVAIAYDSGTASSATPTINVSYPAFITGYIRNGANDGTLTIRFAAETAGTVKVMTGSVIRYRQTN